MIIKAKSFLNLHSNMISTICLHSFALVGTRLHFQIVKFELFANANQYEYLFGICPRSTTNIDKWYSSVLT